jgi:hypothetical protein
MSAQTGLRLLPRRRRNKRLRGGSQEAQRADIGAGISAGAAGSLNGVIEIQLQSNYSANGA